MERKHIYEISSDIGDLNQNNILKPYGYQRLVGKVIDWHLETANLTLAVTQKYDLAWVIVSLSIEILKPIVGEKKMYAQTWYSQRKGPFFRREFVFKNEAGEILFHGTNFSVLLNMDTRTIHREKVIPFFDLQPVGDCTIEATPTIKINSEFEQVDERKVYNSYLDCLGHVNNIRYGEFAYDAFSQSECMNLDRIKRMEFYFRSELRSNDSFSILKAHENGKLIIRGYNDTVSEISFDVVFQA